jgi:hypothetical protein
MFYKKNIKEKRARAQRVPLIVGCVRACVCGSVRASVHAYV